MKIKSLAMHGIGEYIVVIFSNGRIVNFLDSTDV